MHAIFLGISGTQVKRGLLVLPWISFSSGYAIQIKLILRRREKWLYFSLF